MKTKHNFPLVPTNSRATLRRKTDVAMWTAISLGVLAGCSAPAEGEDDGSDYYATGGQPLGTGATVYGTGAAYGTGGTTSGTGAAYGTGRRSDNWGWQPRPTSSAAGPIGAVCGRDKDARTGLSTRHRRARCSAMKSPQSLRLSNC